MASRRRSISAASMKLPTKPRSILDRNIAFPAAPADIVNRRAKGHTTGVLSVKALSNSPALSLTRCFTRSSKRFLRSIRTARPRPRRTPRRAAADPPRPPNRRWRPDGSGHPNPRDEVRAVLGTVGVFDEEEMTLQVSGATDSTQELSTGKKMLSQH
jgi:hypothetical protein